MYTCSYILLLSLLIPIISATHNEPLKNYTFYRLVALTKKDRQILYIIHKNFDHCHFLNGITNEAAIPMHIVVEDDQLDKFEQLINNTDALYTKYDHYVAGLWHNDRESNDILVDDDILFHKFHDYSRILKLYEYWENKYPKIFKKIVIGQTFENKDIIILKVTSLSAHENPAVFMLGGEEGRDWISPAIVLVHVKNLLEEYNLNHTAQYDAYFLPVLNPDGYAYSMSEDRFWSKNRKTIEPRTICHPPTVAKGVNIDRNWAYNPKGEKACDRLYLGRSLSEYETYNLSEFLDSIAPQTLAFFNIKGFDNLITTPYASKDKKQKNLDTIREIMRHTCQGLDAHFNKSYYYGITRNLLFNYTGNCADWVKQYLNVPVVITFYVKHKDNVLPAASDIEPLYMQLSTGVNTILSITTDLYGPLFNSKWQHNRFLLINVICILISINFR